jgi:hypothetical protein
MREEVPQDVVTFWQRKQLEIGVISAIVEEKSASMGSQQIDQTSETAQVLTFDHICSSSL